MLIEKLPFLLAKSSTVSILASQYNFLIVKIIVAYTVFG